MNRILQPLTMAMLFSCAASFFSYNLHAQDTCNVQVKLIAEEPQLNEFFAAQNAVDIDGNTAVVGAFGNNAIGNLAGAVHVFQQQGSEWVETQVLTASDGMWDDRFGKSVSIEGDFLAVGAIHDDLNGPYGGSVYIYKKIGQNWIQQTKVSAPDGLASDRFGWEVELSDGRLAVGSYNDYTDDQVYTGSVYFYQQQGDQWEFVNKVFPEDGGNFSHFGATIEIDGNHAIIGSAEYDVVGDDSGAAFLYAFQDTAWNLIQTLVPEDTQTGAWFGSDVVMNDSTIVIGAMFDLVDDTDSTGAAYVYQFGDSNWVQVQKITTPETTDQIQFGRTLAFNDERLVIGSTRANVPGISNSGATYLYKLEPDGFNYQRKVYAFDAGYSDFYSNSLSMDGDRLMAGAFGFDGLQDGMGAAYIHFLACRPVCTSLSFPVNGAFNVPLDADLSWFPVDDAMGYMITVGTTPGGDDVLATTDVGLVTTYDLPNDLTEDTQYFASVVAYNDAGESDLCEESVFSTTLMPLELFVGESVTIPCYEPVPTPTYITNNACSSELEVSINGETEQGDCPGSFVITRTYIVNDGCAEVTAVQTITVEDTEAPEVISAPADITVACGEELPLEYPIAEDECDSDVTITFSDSEDADCGLVITRTFEIMDDCQNTTQVQQIITIESGEGLPTCAELVSPMGTGIAVDTVITWTAADDATGYILSIGTTPGGGEIVDMQDVGDVTSYEVMDLPELTTIYVSVIAYNDLGQAPFCEEFSFETDMVDSVEELSLLENIELMPNPCEGERFDLMLPSELMSHSPINLQLFNAQGDRVDTRRLTGISGERFTVDLNQKLSAGIYFVQLQGDTWSHSLKLVVK